MKKTVLLLCLCLLLQVAYAQEVSSNIKGLLSTEGKVFFGDEPNSIMVIDYPDNIQRVADYLDAIDVLPAQVLIEARVVEVKLQKEHVLGVNWQLFAEKQGFEIGPFNVGSTYSGPPGVLSQSISMQSIYYPPTQATTGAQTPFTIAIFDENLNIVLRALASSLDTNILSAPRVTTVNNREAEIKIIQKLPWAEPEVTMSDQGIAVTWEVNWEEVGIVLKATPTITEDGKIAMTLNPEVSEKTSEITLTVQQGTTSLPYTVPVIDKRTASTKVVIGNGQTLIIGGLIKDKITNGETKVPILGDVPFLGRLFKTSKYIKDKTELLIFVSPTIITADEYVRMAKDERYRLGRDYMRERDKDVQVAPQMEKLKEEKEKLEQEKLSNILKSLEAKHQALSAERKSLETAVLKQEKDLQELQGFKEAIIKERRSYRSEQK